TTTAARCTTAPRRATPWPSAGRSSSSPIFPTSAPAPWPTSTETASSISSPATPGPTSPSTWAGGTGPSSPPPAPSSRPGCHTPGVSTPRGRHSAGATPADLDGDGQLELIARQSEFDVPARRKIFRRVGPMKWADVTREAGLSEEGSVHGVGDLNQDGHPDLICMEGQQIVIYLNDGKGHFTRKAVPVRVLERPSH